MIPHGHEAGNLGQDLKRFTASATTEGAGTTEILQPNGRICHLGWHVLVHVLVHVLLHVLLHVLDILLVESHHALHDLEVPSLLAVKTGTTRAKSSQRGGQCHRDAAAAAFTWLTTRCLWKDPSKKIRKEAKIYCLNTLPFLRPMYPMLGVQSGLCSHNNPIEQFLSEPRGRLLLAEVKIWLRR